MNNNGIDFYFDFNDTYFREKSIEEMEIEIENSLRADGVIIKDDKVKNN